MCSLGYTYFYLAEKRRDFRNFVLYFGMGEGRQATKLLITRFKSAPFLFFSFYFFSVSEVGAALMGDTAGHKPREPT